MNPAELKAILSLLDDPDEKVFAQIEAKLLEMGMPILEDLELEWMSNVNPLTQKRIEFIMQTIQQNHVIEKMTLWIQSPAKDLIQGACIIAKIHYPNINTAEVKQEVEDITNSIWLEMNHNLTFLEKINTFNQLFYQNYQFQGDLNELYKLEGNFVHTVLERKHGSPILLGIIYMAVAQSLKLPVFGVNLPLHFALAYCKTPSKSVMVYINPVAKGTIFSKNEIKDYLQRMKLDDKKEYYLPINNQETILALAKHLKVCFMNQNNATRTSQLEEVIALFDK